MAQEDVSPFDIDAKGEQVTKYYRELPQDGPIPDDETRTYIFRELINRAEKPTQEE